MIHKKGLVFPSNCASFPKDGRLIYTTVKLTARVYAILMNCVFYYIIQRRANQIILWIRLVQVGVCAKYALQFIAIWKHQELQDFQ